MEPSQLRSNIEALIFVSEEPITEKQLLAVFEESGVTEMDITSCINSIMESANHDPARGLTLVEVAGGYRFRTKESAAAWIQKLSIPKPTRLSQQAMETLSIIAYRQPIVRSEIEAIRGVDVGGVLKTLLERELISIIGRRDEAGQPLIYSTTRNFLELFGLKSLNDLPPLTDIEELARRRVETQDASSASVIKVENGSEPAELAEEANFDSSETCENLEKDEDEILTTIEDGLKNLRRLEREIFPKEADQTECHSEAQPKNPNESMPLSPRDSSRSLP